MEWGREAVALMRRVRSIFDPKGLLNPGVILSCVVRSMGPARDDPDRLPLISLFLRRQRERSGLSLSEAAERLGAKSRNAYARYERGTSMPSLEKLVALYQAVAPGKDIVLHDSVSA
jgi:DNA-binding XRE family transcriptional regulator